jgi:hypothetical protein
MKTRPINWKPLLQVCRPHHAPPTLLAVGGRAVHVVNQFALVPHVVAGGQNVRAKVEKLLGDLGRDAEPAGRVFRVHHDQVHVMRLTHMPDMFAHNPAPRAAKNVADE